MAAAELEFSLPKKAAHFFCLFWCVHACVQQQQQRRRIRKHVSGDAAGAANKEEEEESLFSDARFTAAAAAEVKEGILKEIHRLCQSHCAIW